MADNLRAAILGAVLSLAAVAPMRAEKLVLVAGGGDGADGSPALQAKLTGPFGVAFDEAGNMFIVEMTGNRVRKVDRNGILTTIAGTGAKGNSGDGGPASAAQLNEPHSLAVAANGDIYVSDTGNNRVRRIDARTGIISAFAGTGENGYSGDGGPAKEAKFGGVCCVALEPKGEQMYLADLDNRRIRAVDLKTGIVRTVAGNGKRGVPQDGVEASAAPLVDPRAVAADAQGNVYILERNGNALRVVDSKGRIRTVAGTGQAGATSDNGDAQQAKLNGPKHLCIDLEGNVVIADTENHLIRKYLPREGKIIRIAGTGKKGTAGTGADPLQAQVSQPHGVTVHPSGTLYIADSSNNRVLKIER
jgi:sugar lactone lactonase YvrE